MKFVSSRWALGALIAASTLLSHTAFAQDGGYPNKPIKIVVGFAAGGPADILARIVADTVGPALGQAIVVENKAGAGGTIAATQVAKAPADGYTLMLVSSGHTGNGAYYGNLPYDTVKSFTPIGGVASTPVVILVNANSPYKTLQDMVADARKHPDKLNFGTGGGATLTNLATEQLKSDAKVDVKAIAYKGGSAVLTAVLTGEIEAGVDTVSSSMELARSGRVRMLAVTSAKRSAVVPQVPTVTESGVPKFDITGWYGLIAPAGTPPAVVQKLNTELNKALALPAVRERLQGLGAESMEGTPIQFGHFMESETTRWSALIQRLNLRAQ
ncbi:Bug family tripartite tricarboxylate transporter substrate binding protein [Hydrogenophaga palleronii]|uniref:Bug family tripartite tricarboxylate transporter substrate binding protein n=1 Tax=Hydrogenophaga palleronii TaxID=65655 RepID=UPI000A0366BA|nr:tripartite tricarboxylate transporter substrate binding protein [Hydrogenophaga palleronii]